ncbi:MAG: phosphatase PAP2 family protein [Flavobacteriaceae bacterium]|nr:phosphatase PAP2 family protein [Flavobacteriaceae bacterium]
MVEALEKWDRELFIYLNNLGSDVFDAFWLFVTKIESWTFLYVIFLILIWKFYKKREAFWVTFFTIFTFLISFGVKYITKTSVQRLRPNNVPELSETIRVLQFPVDFSFFSGHAAVSFAVSSFLIFSLKKFTKWVYLFYLWPILFSFSRIYVGVHFPSDILAGTFIGFFIGYGMYVLQRRIIKGFESD